MKKSAFTIGFSLLTVFACQSTQAKSAASREWFPFFDFDATTFQHGNQAILDPTSIIHLTDKVSGNKLNWQMPADGTCRIVTAWSILTGEKLFLIASSKTNYVIDHLGPIVVNKTYDCLPGDQTVASKTEPLTQLNNWSISVGNITLKNSPLIDWRTNEQLKFKSDEGVYLASFALPSVDPAMQYVLDLGKVFFTADVTVNSKSVGKRLFAPYQLDITKSVKPGENQITIKTITARRNAFIGEAVKGKENTLLPTGLVGPVRVLGVHSANPYKEAFTG